jgi:hypothetical protein
VRGRLRHCSPAQEGAQSYFIIPDPILDPPVLLSPHPNRKTTPPMTYNNSFQDRAAQAAEAKKKALDQLRARPPVDEKVAAERLASAREREAAKAEKAAAKKAERKAAQEAAAADATAKAAAAAPPTEAERKAARDARYAARKARK